MTKQEDTRPIARINPSVVKVGDRATDDATTFVAPGLLDVQLESFGDFLSFVETDDAGNSEFKSFLEEQLEDVRTQLIETVPVKTRGQIEEELGSVEIAKIYLDREKESVNTENKCLSKGRTYKLPVRIDEGESGGGGNPFSIPMMTPRATFIVNGQEKVMLSQLVRAPGITFEWERDEFGRLALAGKKPRLVSFRVTTEDGKGPWLKFEVGKNGALWFSVWNKGPIPASIFFRACGVNLDVSGLKGTPLEKSLEKELHLAVETEGVGIALQRGLKEAISSPSSLKRNTPGHKRNARQRANRVYWANRKLRTIAERTLCSYLGLEKSVGGATPAQLVAGFFFDAENFFIGDIGRASFEKSLGSCANGIGEDKSSLNKSDLSRILSCITHPSKYFATSAFNDAEQLSEKRLRRCGDMLKKALKEALSNYVWKMKANGEAQIARRLKQLEKEGSEHKEYGDRIDINLMSAFYKGASRITNEIERVISSSELMQSLDQCNPLSGLTQKRRLSCFGPGGLSTKNIPESTRLIERSHYGRICPIETPEGQKVGVVTSLALYAKVDGSTGAIKTPYRILRDGKGFEEAAGGIAWLSSAEEDARFGYVAEAADITNAYGVSCRTPRIDRAKPERRDSYGLPTTRTSNAANYMDVAKNQLFSVSGSLIPFVDHDDAHRALMGANMQRQAIPLLYPQAPYVGTGLERRAAVESGVIPLAKGKGVVTFVDAKKVVYKTDDGKTYEERLSSFMKSNKGGTINLRPLVKKDDGIVDGQPLADGYATERGDLALGANLLAAYICWEGYNYEDGIVLSQRVLDEDILTSVHILELDVELRDTKFKTRGADGKVQTLKERVQAGVVGRFGYAGRNLSAEGLVRIGSEIAPGDILVAKATFEAKREQSNVDIFLDAVKRGDRLSADFVVNLARRECKLVYRPFTVPDGINGTVIGVDRKPSGDYGVNEVITVRIAQTRKVEIGDKLAGRHGNKGVISKILPTHEMPFLADGTPVDIILNPLGVPSRLNIGQLYECALGWAAKWGSGNPLVDGAPETRFFACPPFDGASKGDIDSLIGPLEDDGSSDDSANAHARTLCSDGFVPLMNEGKVDLFDGRTGKKFDAPIAVGYAYMMKLDHMVQDKVHARSTGPYGQIERQPLKGRSNNGGQRLGDMEGWAIEAYGASGLLHEMFTAKSDTVSAREEMERKATGKKESADKGKCNRLPESTEAFLMYLRALCLKPEYSADASEFRLGYEGSGEWPAASEISEFSLYRFFARKPPVPEQGGLLDESIFGAVEGHDRVSVEERRDRMGYIALSVDGDHPIYHPWFVDKDGNRMLVGGREVRQHIRRRRVVCLQQRHWQIWRRHLPFAAQRVGRIQIDRDGKRMSVGGGEATIELLPVLPAELRPVIELRGGSYSCADLNILYRNIILRNDIVKELRALKSEIDSDYGLNGANGAAKSEDFARIFLDDGDASGSGNLIGRGVQALQLAVDQLIDNGRCRDEAKDPSGRPYESLTDKISGKSGIIRKSLLGKRVDYSGRSVIAPDPRLGFDECGLPYQMAKELFRLQLIEAWLKDDECHGDRCQAEERIDSLAESGRDENRSKLEHVMARSHVLLNRAPTLHRMGIQAYRPILTEEKAIRLHPLACSGFNADFDGDTMAVYAPVGEAARAEAESRMLASLNILSPANGKPLAAPSQDMVVGLYFKTATEAGRTELLDQIWGDGRWSWGDGEEYPEGMRAELDQAIRRLLESGGCAPALDYRLTKKGCSRYVGDVCRAYADAGLPVSDAAPILNRIMWLGFKYATISGLTISYADTVIDMPVEFDGTTQPLNEQIGDSVKQALSAEEDLWTSFETGELTDEEYGRQRKGIWGGQGLCGRVDGIIAAAMAQLEEGRGGEAEGRLSRCPILSIAHSGARGTSTQIRQVIAIRGLMGGSYGEPIDVPIIHGLAEGVSPNEYWLSVYSSRRKVMDTALGTATSGELARTMVNAVQDVVVSTDDCATDKGRRMNLSTAFDKLIGRYLVKPSAAIGAEGEPVALDLEAPYLIDGESLERILKNVSECEYVKKQISECMEKHDFTECSGWIIAADVRDANEKVVLSRGTKLEAGTIEKLQETGIKNPEIIPPEVYLEIRSPLACKAEGSSVCRRCYGWDPSKRNDVEIGDAVGIVAAQSLSEPATQMTLSSFHGGGAAGNDITEGLPRIKELLNASDLKNKARLSRHDGTVNEITIRKSDGREVVRIMPEGETRRSELKDATMPVGLKRLECITVGESVRKGDALSEGAVTPQAMLNAGADELRVAEFIIGELQKQLVANGIDVDDRHLEVIAAEMLRDVGSRVVESGEERTVKDIRGIGYLAKHPHEIAGEPETASFLAAAGVEATRSVLAEAISKAEDGVAIDRLKGFKENLILGRRVPVGTGYRPVTSEGMLDLEVEQ